MQQVHLNEANNPRQPHYDWLSGSEPQLQKILSLFLLVFLLLCFFALLGLIVGMLAILLLGRQIFSLHDPGLICNLNLLANEVDFSYHNSIGKDDYVYS